MEMKVNEAYCKNMLKKRLQETDKIWENVL